MSPKVQSVESRVVIREPTLSSDLPIDPFVGVKKSVDSQTHVCRYSLVISEVRIKRLTVDEILLDDMSSLVGFKLTNLPQAGVWHYRRK